MNEDKKKLEIVSGNGDDLEISPVYDHLNASKPDCHNRPKNIVIPKGKKDDDDDKNSSQDDSSLEDNN